ncbi:DUF6602 domain-containing protein [Fusobacterium necrophorum]|uniref:DUF6602 domain-containing protein n=1 Tax=Fusobacterium necrophorum TaxID=859 RepID=UPI0021BFF378|nr:DUF6602 domain-containing protein [Fusobacterium necrophorum]
MNMCQHISVIKENYRKMEKELVTQLNYQVGNHQLTAGSNREKIWEHFFRRIVPKKFNIERSVFIIDSKEHASREVDIAIYDEQYTPYIFNYGDIKFIPVEAVAAVIQCKSKELDKKILKNWVKSIDDLKTSPNSIVRLATNIHVGNLDSETSTQSATKPIKILCHMSDNETSTEDTRGRYSFDIVIEAYQNQNSKEEKTGSGNDDGNLKITFVDDNLLSMLEKYNGGQIKEIVEKAKRTEFLQRIKIEHYNIKNRERKYGLLSFIFQFNQMLMLINNPMFFPHKAYVDMFNGKKESEEE